MGTPSVTPTAGSSSEKAGLSLTKSGANNPNPIQHGNMGQAERAFSAASTFLSGALAISASQFIGAPLKLVDPKFYDNYMAWTKESFAVLTTTITQWWAPTIVRVSGDESMRGQLYQMDDGALKCNFPHRLVLMANHQLYTDWLYLWWIAYTNKMHGRIYIILKESLKSLPIFGWGAQFYNFIFLSRKWETDRFRFSRALHHLKNPQDPMWLLIFPEGTNLSAVTKEKSASWSKKVGIPDMKHQLLPRTTGLQFCLQQLRKSTNWLYDCTIAYEGVPKGMYGQDVFTLRSSLFEGRPPKSVNMFWRRFRISDIPIDDDQAFSRWLNNRWREKDYILEYYYKFSQFPADDAIKALAAAEGKRQPNHAKVISTEVRGGGWDEFLSIFGPITTAAGALSNIDMTEPLNFDALLLKVAEQQQLNLLKIGKAPLAATSQQTIRNALRAAQAKHALPQSIIDTLMKEAPTTQESMKRALVKAGNRADQADEEKGVAQAPKSKAQMSHSTQKSSPNAPPNQTQQAITKKSCPLPKKAESLPSIPVGGEAANMPRKKPSSPAKTMQQALPLANMEAMVTRPISTLAVQTAAASVRTAAAQRVKQTGTALPGQHVLNDHKVNSGRSTFSVAKCRSDKFPNAPKSTTAASMRSAPAKALPTDIKATKFDKPVPLTAANLNAAAVKRSPSSRPRAAGNQKDIHGKRPQ